MKFEVGGESFFFFPFSLLRKFTSCFLGPVDLELELHILRGKQPQPQPQVLILVFSFQKSFVLNILL
jgi:hypothetical protein